MDDHPEGLHITIVAQGTSTDDLLHEIALVKAALLYADRVTLASPKALLVAAIDAISTLRDVEQREVVLDMLAQLEKGKPIVDQYRALKQKRYRTPQQLILTKRIEAEIAKAGKEFERCAAEAVGRYRAQELVLPLELGILDLHPLGATGDNGAADFSTDTLVDGFAALLEEVVTPGASTYPMLDEQSAKLVRLMVEDGVITNAELRLTAETGLAHHFIGALETFPDAEMDVVIDARRQLRRPLVKFRASVIALSKELDSTPLDDQFPRTAADLYRQHVAPALEELRELSSQMRIRSALRRELPRRTPQMLSKTVAALVATEFAGVESLLRQALLSGVLPVADLTSAVVARRQDLAEKARENQFLFLHQAEAALRN